MYLEVTFFAPGALYRPQRNAPTTETEWSLSTLVPFAILREERKGWTGWGVPGPVGHKDKGDVLEQQALRVPLAQAVAEQSTKVGEKLAVQMSPEQSCCMQGGLVEPITLTREEQPTTSATVMIQTTSAINLEFKVIAMCMEWSINHTMYVPLSDVHDHNVPCAVCYICFN